MSEFREPGAPGWWQDGRKVEGLAIDHGNLAADAAHQIADAFDAWAKERWAAMSPEERAQTRLDMIGLQSVSVDDLRENLAAAGFKVEIIYDSPPCEMFSTGAAWDAFRDWGPTLETVDHRLIVGPSMWDDLGKLYGPEVRDAGAILAELDSIDAKEAAAPAAVRPETAEDRRQRKRHVEPNACGNRAARRAARAHRR